MRRAAPEITFGKVEGESGLVSSQIVDMEDELLREVFLAAPDDPSNTGIHQPILVAAHVDALHQWQPKVPHKLRVQKRCHKASTCGVHVDGDIPPACAIHTTFNPSLEGYVTDQLSWSMGGFCN